VTDKRRHSHDALTILVTNLDRGGAETQAVRLALGLHARGWRVRVLSLLPPRDFVDRLTVAGIPVIGLGLAGAASLPGTLFRLLRELRRHHPDVLATFTYHANVAGKVIGRMAGVPRIVTSIRSEFFGGTFRDGLEKMTGPLADLTTTNAQRVGEKLVERGVVDPGKLAVVPNAVTPAVELSPAEREGLRREMGVSGDDLLWLAVGRFEEAKDYPNLIRAFAIATAERSDQRLAIIGYGAQEDALREDVSAAGLDEMVRIVGRRDDAARYIAACDAYVLSSAWEGLPNTVLEAMVAARPVVATSVGGVPELIDDGVSGLLRPPRDSSALAEAMLQAVAMSREDRVTMGNHGREHVRAHHDVEAVLNRWEAVLRGDGGGDHV